MIEYSSNIFVQRQDGTLYDLGKLGFRVVSFDPPSPNWQHTYQQVGKYGAQLTNSEVQQTTIPLVLDGMANDNYDLEMQRLKLRRIFTSDKFFYVISLRMPYLRWKVVAEAFTMPQLSSFHRLKAISISLDCIDGYAETTATTTTPFKYDTASWGLGDHIPNDEDVEYSFNASEFKVYNGSLIPLLADDRPATITFKGVVAKSLTIANQSNGQTFVLNRALKATDTFVLKGMVPLVNGTQVYAQTNHVYLDISRGWNNFKVTGATDFTISFDTRFYY